MTSEARYKDELSGRAILKLHENNSPFFTIKRMILLHCESLIR